MVKNQLSQFVDTIPSTANSVDFIQHKVLNQLPQYRFWNSLAIIGYRLDFWIWFPGKCFLQIKKVSSLTAYLKLQQCEAYNGLAVCLTKIMSKLF